MADLLDAFLHQLRSNPLVLAVDAGDRSMAYDELGTLAARIAASIERVSPTHSPRVVLALPQSGAAYAGMIGVLSAGGTFCPLNIDGPSARNAAIVRAFSPDVILFEGALPPFLDEAPATTPRLDVSRLVANSGPSATTEHSEVAYVVFTSGSSGQPKGVKIARAAFSEFLTVAASYFDLAPGERWAQYSNLGYDLAVMDVFLALTQGGTLVPLVSPKQRLMPAAAIRDSRVAVWQSVPSVLELMNRAGQISSKYLEPLRIMSFCGEPLIPRHLDALFSARPNLQVLNTYGATETTGFNTINRLNSSNYRGSCEAATVALGEDVPGWTLTLRGGASVDEGEIVVSGVHLGLGYWQDEERTRDAFRQVRVDGAQESRSYYTGDWGVRKNGHLYFSSRIDRQVKIRGERIELDEIDYLLRESGFSGAYTLLVGDELYSFVESLDAVEEERIRAHLAKRLPFHAVPRRILPLPALPRNPNGKVDRAALQALQAQIGS